MPQSPLFHQRFFAELKRRRVFRVMAFYGAASFAALEAADILVPMLGMSEAVTRGVALLLLLGFPIAIILEWAFELTPEGVRRTTEAAPGELSEIITAPASKRWPSGVLALAGMTALLAGGWYAGRQSASASDADSTLVSAPSIAVLLFVNMSSDPEQAFFSDGISEELLNLLAKIPELRVASRTSAFSFKDQGLDIPEIGKRLNVAHVLEGSVRKQGSEVRITAHLVDAGTDTRLRSETWDRTLEDIFAVQDEIAAQVAERLEVTLFGAPPKTAPTDPEAYALFLQGRQFGRQRSAEGSQKAVETLKQAMAHHSLGQEPESDAAVSELIDTWDKDAAYNIAYVLAFKGEVDQAFEWLNKAKMYGDPGLAEVVVENSFDRIQGDPRWLAFLESLGRSDAQLARIEFDVAPPG